MQKKHILLAVSAFLITCFFSSCITARKVNYLQNFSSSASYNDSVGYEEYVLQPTDKVFLRVYSPDNKINTVFNGSNQNISSAMSSSDYSDLYTYIIKDNGTIKLPIFGDIIIAGSSVREARKKVESAINSVAVDKCAIDLRVIGRYFSVIGSSVNGRYPIFREKMNIFQALAMAGDISTFGDRRKIKLLRESPNGVEIKVFDIRRKDIINSEFYYIQPNDVIYIQDVKSQFFSVTSFGAALSTTFSTLSFGMLIYNLATPEKKANSTDTSE